MILKVTLHDITFLLGTILIKKTLPIERIDFLVESVDQQPHFKIHAVMRPLPLSHDTENDTRKAPEQREKENLTVIKRSRETALSYASPEGFRVCGSISSGHTHVADKDVHSEVDRSQASPG
ncbi:hypothetical protein AVEN_202093-1 [Araneus ventricosus]|uniref:Uncharacterized protein n=1 Tax=Araneus ventricosus TaxID=182803 RepID=A0A4Y2QU58_ARAVE|nr:hypothetical protein AVEN_202093-1 [Araneus ventricosus]